MKDVLYLRCILNWRFLLQTLGQSVKGKQIHFFSTVNQYLPANRHHGQGKNPMSQGFEEGLLYSMLYLYPQNKPEVQEDVLSVISDFRNENSSQILHPFAQTNVLSDDTLLRGYNLSTAEYYLVRSVTEVLFFPILSPRSVNFISQICLLPDLLI